MNSPMESRRSEFWLEHYDANPSVAYSSTTAPDHEVSEWPNVPYHSSSSSSSSSLSSSTTASSLASSSSSSSSSLSSSTTRTLMELIFALEAQPILSRVFDLGTPEKSRSASKEELAGLHCAEAQSCFR